MSNSADSIHRPWLVAQIGAREHYAVARALHASGRLERLYTDAWCSTGRSLLRRLPEPARSLANRYHPDLSDVPVTAFTGQSTWNAVQDTIRNRITPLSDRDRYAHYLRIGTQFAERVRDDLLKRPDVNLDDSVFFGYDTGSLEVLNALSDTGCITIVDQIDPGRIEKEIVLEEAERWPGWATQLPVIHELYADRRTREWAFADRIVVNSPWSRSALVKQGVPREKIVVVPLAFEPSAPAMPFEHRSSHQRALTVLWLGSVNLRKGIPYLVEAARLLNRSDITIRVVGPIAITDRAMRSAPDSVTFEGRIPRDQTSAVYRSADMFVLPTLSDGFAITQLEAMSYGLPVITTPRCGRVVTDGVDGSIIPPRDPHSLAERIAQLADDRPRLAEMSMAAAETARKYTLERVADMLLQAVTGTPSEA